MKNLGKFLAARFAERNTRVQFFVLAAAGAVATGLVTTDQVTDWTITMTGIVGVVAPLAAILMPDGKQDVPVEVVANAAMAAAEAAASKVPGFQGVKRDVESIAAAAEDAFKLALAAGK